MRPVEWLLAHAGLDSRWCIVHATHMTDREVAALASSGAVAGLAPCTEADLGDGIFPAEAYMNAGGRVGVGTDANAMIDPFAEIRQLEWSQRLRLRRRNVLVGGSPAPVGQSLWRAAAAGGAQALALPSGRIAPGLRADLKGTPITTTLAEVGTVESTMVDSLRAHEPTRRALARLERLHVSIDLDMGVVVDALVDAIERDKRHVRLPLRDALFPLIVEAPRRLTELLLMGVK